MSGCRRSALPGTTGTSGLIRIALARNRRRGWRARCAAVRGSKAARRREAGAVAAGAGARAAERPARADWRGCARQHPRHSGGGKAGGSGKEQCRPGHRGAERSRSSVTRPAFQIIWPFLRRSSPLPRPISSMLPVCTGTTWRSYRWRAPWAWRRAITRITWEESKRGGAEFRAVQTNSKSGRNPQSSRSRRRFIIIGLVAVLVVGALLFWWHSTFYEDTDDASVDGHLVQISARINGHVAKVNVDQNQYVEAGTLLVEIDPSDYQTAVNQAQANLEAAIANYEAPAGQRAGDQHQRGQQSEQRQRRCGQRNVRPWRSPKSSCRQRRRACTEATGECDQVEARSGSLHAAGAEGHHLEAAVRCGGSRGRGGPGRRGGGGSESDRGAGCGAHRARIACCRRSPRRNTRRRLRNRWRSRRPKPIRLQARWIRHAQRWRRRS